MVIWSIPAKNDLKKVYDYIAKDSKFYATRTAQNIIEKSEKLTDYPEMGRIVPETDSPIIRELIVCSFRLIYKVSKNEIKILTILHAKQDFSSKIINKLRRN